MKKKLLALLLCVGMLAEAAIPLFANDVVAESDYDETENGIAVETDSEETNELMVSTEQETYENEKTLYIEDGNITISVNDNGQTTYSQNYTEGLCDTLYLSNRDTATRYNGTVIINSVEGFEIHVVLRDLSIESNGNAFLVQGNGSVNIELDGNNILKSASPYAGLEIDTTSSIVINDVDNNGSLGAQGGGAGIGSATNRDNGKITINGGTIRAIGGFNSAGIGGGDSGSAGLITINGGSITAQCAWYGCGIGSGSYSDEGGRIIINGGSIVANSSVHGAGIGGAESGFVDEIIIDGGEITSSGRGWEAGMGDGHGNSKSVVILNGKVTSTGGKYDLGFADGAVRVTSVAGRNEDGTFTTVNHIHTFDTIVSDTPATYDSPRLISFYCLNSECSKYGELIEYPIGEKLEFVIPDDAVYYNGSYYKVYTITSNAIGSEAWSEANKYCTDVGGHLAVIGNQEENDFLAGYLKEKNYSSAYFGYTDEEVEGTWIWVDCEEVSTYENWAEGEPNSSSEDYAMFYFAGGNRFSDGQWNNGHFGTITLSDDKNFICEWNVIIPPQSPTITGVQPTYTLALGDTLTLDGTLTAAGDGKLNVVTLKHNETGTTFTPRRMELNGSTNAFNLADFGVLTTDEYPLNTVGVHEFVIYASADNYTVTNNAITSFAVQVVEAVEESSETVICNNPVDYAGNYRSFTATFRAMPASAYLQFDNQHDPNQWLDEGYCADNVLFRIDLNDIVENDGQYVYETEFRIHSEGLASENFMRKVRVVADYTGEKTVSAAYSFQVNPIPERDEGNTIGCEYQQTFIPAVNADKPVIKNVTSHAESNGKKILSVLSYDCDASASPFFWWKSDCGTFYKINDDFTKVGFIPNGSGTVTVYMGDGLGYVTSYELTTKD